MNKLRVLVLLPYPPGRAPSQRFRIEHFIPLLESKGIQVTLAPFLTDRTWEILYRDGKYFSKLFGFLRGFVKRYLLLFSLRRYDIIWVHRETAPIGLPLLAWVMTKVLKKKVYFEFDDAIWMPNVSDSNRNFSFLKPYRNALYLMKNATVNVCGNDYLRAFAAERNPNSICLPTVVDTEKGHSGEQIQDSVSPVIGWTGSHSTLRYLEDLVPLLNEVYLESRFELVVISDLPPSFDFPELRFIKWSAENESADLLNIHIGLMPLPNEEWAKGKCGLKLIQYMALGIVPVASNVGVNSEIVSADVNGFLCSTPEEWKRALLRLLNDSACRQDMARTCRQKIVTSYSVESQRDKFLHLFAENH